MRRSQRQVQTENRGLCWLKQKTWVRKELDLNLDGKCVLEEFACKRRNWSYWGNSYFTHLHKAAKWASVGLVLAALPACCPPGWLPSRRPLQEDQEHQPQRINLSDYRPPRTIQRALVMLHTLILTKSPLFKWVDRGLERLACTQAQSSLGG